MMWCDAGERGAEESEEVSREDGGLQEEREA